MDTKPTKTQLNVKLEAELADWLRAKAERERRPIATVMTMILEDARDRDDAEAVA